MWQSNYNELSLNSENNTTKLLGTIQWLITTRASMFALVGGARFSTHPNYN